MEKALLTNRIVLSGLFIVNLLLAVNFPSLAAGGENPAPAERKPATVRATKLKLPANQLSARPFDNDPIRFVLQADKRNVRVGEEVSIAITAHYMNLHPSMLFTFAGSNAFRLKVIVPEGFVQTGGDYVDYIGTELSATNPTVTYKLVGYFNKINNDQAFRLLRGHANADANSLFVEKSRLAVAVKAPISTLKAARSEASNTVTVSPDCGASVLNISGYLSINNGRVSILVFKDNAVVGALSDIPGPSFSGSYPLSGSGTYSVRVMEVNNDGNSVSSSPVAVNCSGGNSNPNTPPSNPNNPPINTSTNNATVNVDCGASRLNISGHLAINNGRVSILIFKDNAVLGAIGDVNGPSFNTTYPINGSGTYFVRVMEVNNDGNQVTSPAVAVNCSGGNSNPGNPPSNQNPPSSNGNCSVSRPRGNVDVLNGVGISGWALDEADLNKTLTIDIYINGVKVASGAANGDRPDLVGAFGNNPAARYHGFRAEWQYNRSGSNNYTISAKICGTDYWLRTEQVTIVSAYDPYGLFSVAPVDGGTLPEVKVTAPRLNDGGGGTIWVSDGYNSGGGSGGGSNTGGSGGDDHAGSGGSGSENPPKKVKVVGRDQIDEATDYRLYTKSCEAYEYMFNKALAINSEVGAFITDKGIILIPNNNAVTYQNGDRGFNFGYVPMDQNGYYLQTTEGKVYISAMIHTHPNFNAVGVPSNPDLALAVKYSSLNHYVITGFYMNQYTATASPTTGQPVLTSTATVYNAITAKCP